MIKVAVTGGIGSGKSFICEIFNKLGTPIYYSDIKAKEIMNNSKIIKNQIIKAFTNKAYIDNKINKKFISDIIFSSKENLSKINNIVHPELMNNFNNWLLSQNTPYIIMESAIIFENKLNNYFDKIIHISCPDEIKIARLKIRNKNLSENDMMKIINNQLPDYQKEKMSDFIINNTNNTAILDKIINIDLYLKN